MTPPDQKLLEDLCAWIDGELPPDQARFLERRIANEPALQAQVERWQLASASLRGQPLRLMPAGMAERVAAAIREEPTRRPGHRWPWAAGIAAAVLGLALLPGLVGQGGSPGLPPAPELARSQAPLPPLALDVPVARVSPVPRQDIRELAAGIADEPSARPWPRSPLEQGDRAVASYLVRHNALMASDGLGGLLPSVDVVAHGQSEAGAGRGDGEQDRR
ncbi:RseA family anti-sigma factor [Arenimonas sp.]|uniref:RseA family anti-sigma factor n=1 Tax=Arenimonas sp. TaxID=1872635 RepID=UPI0035B319E4